MSPQNLKENVQLEIERGRQALEAARELLRAGLLYDAVSRAYYGVFHHARALCLAAGEEPRSHQGVGHLLSLRLVKSGELPVEISRVFARLQKYREASDYDSAFTMDLAGATEAVADAEAFVAQSVEWLRRKLSLD